MRYRLRRRPDRRPETPLSAWLGTRYRAWLPAGELALAIGAPFPTGAGVPSGQSFALITAWNPGARRRDRFRNEVDQRRLRRRLSRLAASVHEASGASPDGRWHEPGLLALGLPLRHADRLARDFGQRAILCGASGAAVRLRVYGPRRRRPTAGVPGLDWVSIRAKPARR